MNTPQTAKEIISSLPFRFRKEKALDAKYETLFHFLISGSDGGEFTVEVKNGECLVHEGLQGNPLCKVEVKDSNYADIEWGRTNPQMAVFTGKIKISEIAAMLTFTGMFRSLQRAFGEG